MTKSSRIEWPTILFWGAAVVLMFTYLGANALWGAEDRWAQVAREMLRSGDYFHPRINGEPYFDKPLLSYWFIALAAAITGRLNEAIVRLPSAIAGLLALWATMNLARRLWSREEARTAGWILLTTYGFIFWARTGEADMENLAAIILAVAWYWYRREKPGFLSYVVFYLICFVGAQTKGLGAVVVPLVVVFPDIVAGGRWRSHLTPSSLLGHVLAMVVGLGVYMAPLVYAGQTAAASGYADSGIGLAIRENIIRYIKPFDHKEKFYVYFGYLPLLLVPWTPLFVAALWRACVYFKKMEWAGKWLALSVVLIFMFFTLSGSRRSYYILPVVPFCAILEARFLTMAREEKWDRLALGIQFWVIAGVAAFEVAGGLAWPLAKQQIPFVPPDGMLVAMIIAGIAAMVPLALERVRPGMLTAATAAQARLAPMIAMSAVILGGYFCALSPILSVYHSVKQLALDLKPRIASIPPKDIAYYSKIANDVLFYADVPGPVLRLRDVESLKAFLNSDRKVKVLISLDSYRDQLAKGFPNGVVPEPTLKEQKYPWEKENKYEAWIIPNEGT
jgi:4-amino-4-deoxy-L-arabinose transferase-like glycosyltransferase